MNTETYDPSRELCMRRTYRATPETILRMLSDPEMITHWWGPYGFTTTTHKMDFRPGGEWIFTMHGPDGTDYPNIVKYIRTGPDVVEYEHMNPDDTIHFHAILTIQPVSEEETEMEFRMILESAEVKTELVELGAEQGLKDTTTRLAEWLAERESATTG